MMKLEPVKLASVEKATRHALRIRLEGVPRAFEESYRLPGMIVRLKVGDLGPHPLSLSSQPERPGFEALVARATPLGEAIAALEPGAEIGLSAPSGAGFPAFEYRRHDLVLIGHGMGLGPVRAAALHALTERGAFDEVRVLAEGHFLDEIPFRDEFPGWQRAGIRVYQVLARPDMGKWRKGEGAYVFDLLRDLGQSPSRTVVFASGPEDLCRGVHGVLLAAGLPPEKLFIHEIPTAARERASEAERPKEFLDKIAAEGVFGSGHQKDAPDHAPGYRTPAEQPAGRGLAPYQRPRSERAAH